MIPITQICCDVMHAGFWLDKVPDTAQLVIIVLIVLAVGLAALLLLRRWLLERPTFSHLSVEKMLVFLDPKGNTARLTTRMTTRANHSGLSQMWFRNINADGRIENILLDGIKPEIIRKKAGSLEIAKQFGHTLRRGEVFRTELSYDLHDSFPSKREGITHVTGLNTMTLVIRVRFHQDRSPEGFRAFVGYGSSKEQPLAMPSELDQKNHEVSLKIKRPQVGAYYTIEWDW
jgi:hypothetical protein